MNKDDEVKEVLMLDVPKYDPSRKFEGLERQKIKKKDNHHKALEEFSVFLDNLSNELEQEVLKESRNIREIIDNIDTRLKDQYKMIEDDNYLVQKDDNDIYKILDLFKFEIQDRSNELSKFADVLEQIEIKRSVIVESELKSLVDKLVGFAHKLRDDIEHIVEAETHELNIVLATNRSSHAKLLAMLRQTHVETEIEALQRWEDAQKRWRQLRHHKAMREFNEKISDFNDPEDRRQFLSVVREHQNRRHNIRLDLLDSLSKLDVKKISSHDIISVQREFTAMNENELTAIQDCYNGITDLRTNLVLQAEERVEALRSELHHYAALKEEPKLAIAYEAAVNIFNDESLKELFRVSGGLKAEINQLAQDLHSNDIYYNHFISSIRSQVEIMICGFPIKDILQNRGRSVLLDRIKNTVIKMKSIPKSEVANLIEKFLLDLQEILDIDQFPPLFLSTVRECFTEMTVELQRVREAEEDAARLDSISRAKSGLSRSVSSRTSKSPTASRSRMRSSLSSRTSKRKGGGGGGGGGEEKTGIDALQLKLWNKKLSVLFFSTELLDGHKEALQLILRLVQQQFDCNVIIDDIITKNCHKAVQRLDTRYRKLIDSIANFLEVQAASLSVCTTNTGDFFLSVTKVIELHRKTVHELHEKSMDELWDYKEDYRLECEDKEEAFLKACDKLRQSVGHEELRVNFEEVLSHLNGIQESYRVYHNKACYLADKHPLSIAEESKGFLESIALKFQFSVIDPNPVKLSYKGQREKMIRLNKGFLSDEFLAEPVDPAAVSVPPQPLSVSPVPLVGGMARSGNLTPATPTNSKSTPTAAAKPSLLSQPSTRGIAPQPPQSTPTLQATTTTAIPVLPTQLTYAVEFNSRNVPPSKGGMGSSTSSSGREEGYGGHYGMRAPMSDFLGRFYVEAASSEELAGNQSLDSLDSEDQMSVVSVPPAIMTTSRPQTTAATAGNQQGGSQPEVHETAPWLASDLPLLTVDNILALVGDEKEEYEERLLNGGFRELDSAAILSLSPESSPAYQSIASLVQQLREQAVLISSAAYIKSHPPLDAQGNPWISPLEVPLPFLERVVVSLRDAIIAELELELDTSMRECNQLNKDRKGELTEELEDRLRTHWPRRGRVETEIKQPRESELLGHEEKTWRHIESIHDRVLRLQMDFNNVMAEARKDCDHYVHDITSFRNNLSSHFKTLAMLQGVDAKARSVLLNFQSKCSQHITKLKKMNTDDFTAIKSFASDFRKVCPPQVPGKEGGYSETELAEIEKLVNDQIAEIDTLSSQWSRLISELVDHQTQCMKSQGEFSQRYDAKTQELSLSEGLGQKYGAPRRRAQGKLRTEVTRDEQSAGKVDELLAQLEFLSAEEWRKAEESCPPERGSGSGDPETETEAGDLAATSHANGVAGRASIDKANEIWMILGKIRVAVQRRAVYLKALLPQSSSASTASTTATLPDLSWMIPDRIPSSTTRDGEKSSVAVADTAAADLPPQTATATATAQTGATATSTSRKNPPPVPETNTGGVDGMNKLCFVDVVEEADAACRKETRELYISEGRGDALEGQAGVPEALQVWLRESKEKLLGAEGHLERACKRLWLQVERLEGLLARRPNKSKSPADEGEGEEEEGDSVGGEAGGHRPASHRSVGKGVGSATTICLRLVMTGYLEFMKQQMVTKEYKFSKVLQVLEKGRVKHERNLRPRLGSPDNDAVEELAQLDALECQRSRDLSESVSRFRGVLIKYLVELARNFLEDISACSRGLMEYLNTTLHQGLLQVPPGFAVAKKRLTTKRLRKAQKIKSAVEQGEEDRSKERTWPAISADRFLALAESIEVLLSVEDETNVLTTNVKPKKPPQRLGSTKKVSTSKIPSDSAGSHSLLLTEWVEKLQASSAIRGTVSSGHRAVVEERNNVVDAFVDELTDMLDNLKDKYERILQAEAGWVERWNKQVTMLREGNL